MRKKLLIIAGAIISLGIIALVIYNIYINSYVPSEEVAKKVVFEGLQSNVAGDESYDSVVQKISEVDQKANPKLVITVETTAKGLEKSETDFDSMTSEEIDAWLKEHRRLFLESNRENSSNIAKELGLDSMNITYEYSGLSPHIYAEFMGKLTKKDLVDIYKIAKHSKVISVTVQVAEINDVK